MKPSEHLLLCCLLCMAFVEFEGIFPAKLAAGHDPGTALYVAVEGDDHNSGRSASEPFATVSEALKRARPGDTILVAPGVYEEQLETSNQGEPERPITLRGTEPGEVVVTYPGKVLQLLHPHYVIEGMTFDGQFGDKDVVKIKWGGHHLVFRDNIVRHGGRDGIDLDNPAYVLIENCLIHHMLWLRDGERKDAHGIVTTGATDLVIRDTEVHYVSGDAFQAGYGKWDRIVIEGCRFWNGPLPESAAGFPAGTNPGENAIDTKKWFRQEGGHLVLRNCEFAGWNGRLIDHCSAVNLKHRVNVVVDGCLVRDSHIAFRLRGPVRNKAVGGATVTIMNSIICNNAIAVRYEDGIQNLRIVHNTFGLGNGVFFTRAPLNEPIGRGFVAVNNLFVGLRLPPEAGGRSNRLASPDEFVDVGAYDYRLLPTSGAIGAAGSTVGLIPGWYEPRGAVLNDHAGRPRGVGGGLDCGAYEFQGSDEPDPYPTEESAP